MTEFDSETAVDPLDVDEAELIARIQAGDKSACDECIAIHSPALNRLLVRLLGNEQDAEDALQESFLNAFRAIDNFEARSSLSTWLYRIAYNTAMMRLRRPKTNTVSVEETLDETPGYIPRQLFDWCCLPEETYDSEEVQLELRQAIASMPETLQLVFTLRELEGMSTAETADTLDISPSAAKVRLHRARQWLRETLGPILDPDNQSDPSPT
ncbi:MAG: sigma-70 family RNA polymerase sigma factor [Ardenticatenaceae bacterium]|nr:sigma-70 family RNA polymerase sigma factor [Ardenticatenaceae bacterium]MCB8948405.1 sigma-70 family RNA polymerase sigma factor [Ardenticatenaceae bacterium]